MNRRFLLKLLVLATFLFAGVSQLTYAQTPKKGIKVFVELTPAGDFTITSSSIIGKVKRTPKGLVAKNLYVKVDSLKTGVDLRDDHVKKRLKDGKKYKKIIIKKGIARNGKGKAIIEVKGIKKKFPFTYTETKKYMIGEFSLSIKDFKIKDVKYLGVGAKDKIKVKFTVPIVD
jgi:hypothetical protein